MNKDFKEIIKEICDELGIEYKIMSKDWVIMLEKNGVKKFISGFKFDLNSHALGQILDDKYATYDLLKNCKIAIIEHNIIYGPNNKNDYAIGCNTVEYVEELFEKYDENIVLKINGGTCGNEVIHITDLQELKDKYEKLSKRYHSFSLCPFYDIENEYRAIVVGDKIELLYKKIKASVTGDGKRKIKDLLIDFNPTFFEGYDKENADTILDDGEIFEYDWRFNLCNGAKASFDIAENDKSNITNLASKIAKEIGVKFGSIDIIKTTDGRYYTMEINSGVMMDNLRNQLENGYNISKEIYKKAIENLFMGE